MFNLKHSSFSLQLILAMTMTVGTAKEVLKAVTASLNDEAALKKRVEDSFARLDVDKSGHLDHKEARRLVDELNGLMGLPQCSDEDYATHFKALDQDGNGSLNVTEMGGGVVAALNYKKAGLEHYLAFAARDNTPDDQPLPLS